MPQQYSDPVLIEKEKTKRYKMKQKRKLLNGCFPWLVFAMLGFVALYQIEAMKPFLQWLLTMSIQLSPLFFVLFCWGLLPPKARDWLLRVLRIAKFSDP